MRLWKKLFLIEGSIASKYMFETMYRFLESSMFFPCKVSNDAAATSSLLLTTSQDYLFFDILTPNYYFFHW